MKLCDLLQEQADALRVGKEYAVVTIVESEQLARTNGKMIVYADGTISGTVGGGHVGNAVIRAAKMVGFTTTLVDTRDREIIGDSIDLADRFIKVPSFEDVARADLPREPYYVISTYGHMVDGAALGAVLSRGDARYVGMLGGRKKIRAIYEKLEAAGFDRALLEQVHSPIGLDLGGETPEELSIAIVGEIMAVKNGRTGLFLNQK